MKNKIFKKSDLIIIGLVLAVAIAALLFWPRQKGNVAVVSYNGEVVLEINLSDDGIYHIEGDLPVTLEVRDNHIRFINSVCPDHICEGYGFIGDEFESAICMPAKVVVLIREG